MSGSDGRLEAVMMFENPDPEALREILLRVKTIAVVGLSPNPERPSHRIARRLQGWGYRVIPVHPGVAEVLGEKAYPRLADVPVSIDLVDVFRPAEAVAGIVEECISLDLPAIWIQQGIVNEAAALRAASAGMFVVMDRCISVEYRSLISRE
jgi:predicted CoA-binding protein